MGGTKGELGSRDEKGEVIWKVKKRAGKVNGSLKLLTFSVPCRYENKYVKFFKSKPELPPGLSPDATAPVTPSRLEGGEPGLSKTAKRNLKRKEKRRQQQEKGEAEALSRTLDKVSLGETAQLPSAPQGFRAAPTAASDQPDSAATTEKAKKIKNLKKKLRQVEELQQRIQAGEISQPSKEQLEKLARRRALEEELEDLELGL